MTKKKLPSGGSILFLPVHEVIKVIIKDPTLGPLLKFQYDPSACGHFWAHEHMRRACETAKTISAGIGVE